MVKRPRPLTSSVHSTLVASPPPSSSAVKVPLILPFWKLQLRHRGFSFAGKDDLGLAAVGVLFRQPSGRRHSPHLAADIPAPAVEGRLGQIQPHLVGVTGIICGHYTAFHGLDSPYFFPRPNRLCSRPARLGRSAARCRGYGFYSGLYGCRLGLGFCFWFLGLVRLLHEAVLEIAEHRHLTVHRGLTLGGRTFT